MSSKAKSVSEQRFASFLGSLPELCEQESSLFTEEELKAAFKRIDEKGAGEITQEQFLDQFQRKYVCTAESPLTGALAAGSPAVRALCAGEVLAVVLEPARDDASGLTRAKVKAEKDGKDGYVTLQDAEGNTYLQAYTPYSACEMRVERALEDMTQAIVQTTQYFQQKTDELKAVRGGPLADTKAELFKLKPRVNRVQVDQAQLRRRVTDAQKRYAEFMEGEKKRRQEALDRKEVKTMMDKAYAQASALEEQADAAVPAAEALVKSRGAGLDNPLESMGKAQKDLKTALESFVTVQSTIASSLEETKASAKKVFSEARGALVSLSIKVTSFEKRCQKQVAALKDVCFQIEEDAHSALVAALRAHLQKEQGTPEAVFGRLSDGKPEIPIQKFQVFVKQIPGTQLKASQIDIGLKRYPIGITKLGLFGMLQAYFRCVKDIAITTSCDVKAGKTIRKLGVGEIIEILDFGNKEENSGLTRAKCRALADSKEGWVSLQGNQGTSFLEKCAKPYHCCKEADIQSGFDSSSPVVRKTQLGEVLEVLEGPRQEDTIEVLRARCKALKDGKVGWLTFDDRSGSSPLELMKFLVCKQSIAFTNSFDIGEGKAIRKLDVGEILEPLEEPRTDSKRGFARVKARAKRDGKEGYVTLKGNQGTAFVADSDKHYVCKKAVVLEVRFASRSGAVRALDEGEVVEMYDSPKPEQKEGARRMKGRNLNDGTEGWLTLTSARMTAWNPNYTCLASTALTDGIEAGSSKTVRNIDPGENLKALDTPVVEPSSGFLRVNVCAEKDAACGFATVRGTGSTCFLEPAAEC